MQKNFFSIWFSISVVFITICVFIQHFVFANKDITITLLLLVGVWIFDISLKWFCDLDNTTAFYGLSFAALVFHLGRIVNLIVEGVPPDSSQDETFMLVLIGVVLATLCLSNMLVCSQINKLQQEDPDNKGCLYWGSWLLSFFFAFASTCFVLLSLPPIMDAINKVPEYDVYVQDVELLEHHRGLVYFRVSTNIN